MNGIYDVHNHFIFGVDDGAKNIKESLALIENDYQAGVRTIILTPHYRKGMFEPTVQQVSTRYQILKETVALIHPDLELLQGREFHVNMEMIDTLNEDPSHYCLGNSTILLTEFSSAHSFNFIRERLYHLIVNGYVPLVAHVERYPDLVKDLDNLVTLREMGCYIQVNADTISGKSGYKQKRLATKMLDEGLIDLVGTDGHNLTTRIPGMAACKKRLIKLLGEEEAHYLLCERPKELLIEHNRG
ncbi:protein-tyrosine phosphatase [Granulicatella balaenopterae]|uniref:Tyrosine-protein phosphatase n=1 Tax=Granulicatella balaenopterae TaxID=137733 RepID=A0A1H9K8E1_9LACT|nr:CpsB/CapC family capsule biosynthesis tyrosine phosphatase [Granulicatella balaenopterae]SEQ95318.1 protein-tyrosine phosphatase [Granulicatella balaenopterae]